MTADRDELDRHRSIDGSFPFVRYRNPTGRAKLGIDRPERVIPTTIVSTLTRIRWSPMGKRRIRNTPHAVGDHGPKTERHIMKQLHSAPPKLPAESYVESARSKAAFEGKRRLVEDRQQHDEGEKNSEHKRLFIEARRGRDNGPSDNSGNLHGVLGSRAHRADFKERGPDGLVKRQR